MGYSVETALMRFSAHAGRLHARLQRWRSAGAGFSTQCAPGRRRPVSAQVVTGQVCGVSELCHNTNPTSAAAAEPAFPDGVTSILTFAEELLIGHNGFVRMKCPPVLQVGLVIRDPNHQASGLDRPHAESANVKHVRA